MPSPALQLQAAVQVKAGTSPVPPALGPPGTSECRQWGQRAITLLSSLPGAMCHSLRGFLPPLAWVHLGLVLCVFQPA